MDPHRIVALFDLDCFYAQVETLKRPHLAGVPVGITQKFLVVTTNYAARQLGVPKMVAITEALAKCPQLILINGEDLTPYRAASKRILQVLSRYGTLERLGLDEAFVDLTPEVYSRIASGNFHDTFQGHVVVRSAQGLQDLPAQEVGPGAAGPDALPLIIGTQVAAEARRAVEAETGFQLSCGISHNKILAKLACGLHKPNGQTALSQDAAPLFMAPLAVRKLAGVGHKIGESLQAKGISSVEDLRRVELATLHAWFGERVGTRLHSICRGLDSAPVEDKGPPKSVTVEDSFLSCKTPALAKSMLQRLAPDLVARLDEDWREFEREPRTLTARWRARGNGWRFTAASCPMPAVAQQRSADVPTRATALVEAASPLVARAFASNPELNLVVLNIGATNFSQPGTAPLQPGTATKQTFMASFLRRQGHREPTQPLTTGTASLCSPPISGVGSGVAREDGAGPKEEAAGGARYAQPTAAPAGSLPSGPGHPGETNMGRESYSSPEKEQGVQQADAQQSAAGKAQGQQCMQGQAQGQEIVPWQAQGQETVQGQAQGQHSKQGQVQGQEIVPWQAQGQEIVQGQAQVHKGPQLVLKSGKTLPPSGSPLGALGKRQERERREQRETRRRPFAEPPAPPRSALPHGRDLRDTAGCVLATRSVEGISSGACVPYLSAGAGVSGRGLLLSRAGGTPSSVSPAAHAPGRDGVLVGGWGGEDEERRGDFQSDSHESGDEGAGCLQEELGAFMRHGSGGAGTSGAEGARCYCGEASFWGSAVAGMCRCGEVPPRRGGPLQRGRCESTVPLGAASSGKDEDARQGPCGEGPGVEGTLGLGDWRSAGGDISGKGRSCSPLTKAPATAPAQVGSATLAVPATAADAAADTTTGPAAAAAAARARGVWPCGDVKRESETQCVQRATEAEATLRTEGDGDGEPAGVRPAGTSSPRTVSGGRSHRLDDRLQAGASERGVPAPWGRTNRAGAAGLGTKALERCECGELVVASRFAEHVLSHFQGSQGGPQQQAAVGAAAVKQRSTPGTEMSQRSSGRPGVMSSTKAGHQGGLGVPGGKRRRHGAKVGGSSRGAATLDMFLLKKA